MTSADFIKIRRAAAAERRWRALLEFAFGAGLVIASAALTGLAIWLLG